MKLTQTTLKQVIKEETQKVLKEWGKGGWFSDDPEEDIKGLYDEAGEDDDLEIRDSPDADDGARKIRMAKKVLKRLRQKLNEQIEEYKKIYGSLKTTWKKMKEEGKIPDYALEYESFEEWKNDGWRYGSERITEKWRKDLSAAKAEMNYTKKLMKVVVTQAKEAMKVRKTKAAEAAAAKEQEKPTTWVGKSRQEVLKALQDEFKIRPTRNWYKKLPVRHPARVKFREWYKASRGR